MSKKNQSKEYFNEAKLTFTSAKAIYDKANKKDIKLWADVVKNGYDAIEKAISAAIAYRNQNIPTKHPAKITKFTEIYNCPKEIEDILMKWLNKRSNSQYVDIKGEKINIPHEKFGKQDAKKILEDTEKIMKYVRSQIKEE